MKNIILFILAMLFVTRIAAQTTESYQDYLAKIEAERSQLWQNKDFAKAASLLKDTYKDYMKRDVVTRNTYKSYIGGLFYNIACAYSLNSEKDSALVYLQKAYDAGFADYNNALVDTDLTNIRDDARYTEIISKLRERGDYKYVLKLAGKYETTTVKVPQFTYTDPSDKALTAFRTKYNLDSVAGNGNELSKIINLMRWVHHVVKHDGNSTNPKDRGADALIEVCKKENRGINCRMMAMVLNEAYLSMGIKSRFITCMPKGEVFDDCHVINEAYSETLHKWIWMDPTFEAYVQDDKGNYLNIAEVRERLINDLPVAAPKTMNWNGSPYGGGPEAYLNSYMSKNLYRFSIALNSCSGYENLPFNLRTNVELYPVVYNEKKVELNKKTGNVFYTNDAEQYWRAPEK